MNWQNDISTIGECLSLVCIFDVRYLADYKLREQKRFAY